MKTMWVIHHKSDYTKSIEEVTQPSPFELVVQAHLVADNGRTSVISEQTDGFGDQYVLWTEEEAADWQARYDAATGGTPT